MRRLLLMGLGLLAAVLVAYVALYQAVERQAVLDETATSTQESIAAARAAAQVREWETVLVVSEPFHMLRARQMARDAGLDAYASLARGSAIQRIERLRRFYTAREAAALLWYLTLGRFVALG